MLDAALSTELEAGERLLSHVVLCGGTASLPVRWLSLLPCMHMQCRSYIHSSRALITPCLPPLCQGLAARLSYELHALGQQHGMPTEGWDVHPATHGDGATFVGATVGTYTHTCMSHAHAHAHADVHAHVM